MTSQKSAEFPDFVAEAEQAIASMREGYRVHLQRDAVQLEELSHRIEGVQDPGEILKEIFSICHNIKGQAGSFGYELITDVAASLCTCLREGKTDAAVVAAAAQHVRVLITLIDKDVGGSGGDVGRAILAKLRALPGK